MNDRPPNKPDRRRFLRAALGLGAGGAWLGRRAAGDELRAISGDRVEPAWESLLSVTVGPRDADVVGASDRAIQAAVDFISARGGGTVKITPGSFKLRNAVHLPSRVRLIGAGAETILIKEPSTTTKLAASADWYDQEVTLADADGFQVGDGVCFRAKNPSHGGPVVIKRTLVGRSGARFKLDRALRENLWLQGEPTVSTLFPLVSCENAEDVEIANLALDGNRANNVNLDGNYAGCVFAQDCSRLTIRDVVARHNNGDGLSWQICHDVLVERCTSHDHAGLGMHPGSGSQRPIIRDNRIMRSNIGVFFCWGVRFGLAERNTIEDVQTAGVSIGHRDVDNVVRHNTIVRSGEVGVLFRDETHEFAAHRNRFENNTIVDSGPADGVGIDVQGQTESVVLARNQVRETRGPTSRIGVRLGPRTKGVELVDNRIEGFARELVDLRES